MNISKIKEFKGRYRFLSNFYLTPVIIDGMQFRSAEHAYMSFKSNNKDWKLKCMSTDIPPGQIKKLSKDIVLVEHWDKNKTHTMEKVIWAKFQSQLMKEQLLETGDAIIEEGNEWNDRFWGVDLKTGIGENNLGIILMKTRDKLRTIENLVQAFKYMITTTVDSRYDTVLECLNECLNNFFPEKSDLRIHTLEKLKENFINESNIAKLISNEILTIKIKDGY